MAKKNTPSQKKTYEKLAIPHDDLIKHIKNKGLIINDDSILKNALTHIGYYRLRGYFYPFYETQSVEKIIKEEGKEDRKKTTIELVSPKTFSKNSNLNDVIELYNFDRRIRLLIIEQIQIIEISLRNCLCEHMSQKYGSHWFMNLSIMSVEFDYDGFFKQISSAKELFISHFYETYSAPKYPPSWMIAETLSFGTWSRVFSNLRLKDQKEISNIFNINKPEILAGWFHTLTVLRNFCAHHNRIWNRNFQHFIPSSLDAIDNHMKRKNSIYCRFAMLRYLTKVISLQDNFNSELKNIISKKPSFVKLEDMGFIPDWELDELWK